MIHCIGDSHAAVFSGREEMAPAWPERSSDTLSFFRSYRIGPATAYQLENKIPVINDILHSCVNKEDDSILFCFGEVDIRAHLVKQAELQKVPIEQIVEECVDRYFRVILYYKELGYKTLTWGPIASWHPSKVYLGGPSYGTCEERNRATQLFNERLELRCKQYSIEFISIFNRMVDSDGITIPTYLDNWENSHIHLSQTAMPLILEAFKQKNLI
jgi:hypothetical protein